MPDPQAPESWIRYRKGLCAGCGAGCCALPVQVRETDLVRLELMSEAEVGWPLEPVAKRLFKRRLIQDFDPQAREFMLAQRANANCVFLDAETRRCTVYEQRPDTCRDFPRVGPRPGFCPAS